MCVYSMMVRDWTDPNSPNYTPIPGWPTPGETTPVKPLPWEPVNPYVWPKIPKTEEVPVIPAIPLPDIFPVLPANPPVTVTPDIAKLMLEILKKVDELDKKMGRIDCLLNEKEKIEYVNALRKVAGEDCPCVEKKKTRKVKKPRVKPQLLTENT